MKRESGGGGVGLGLLVLLALALSDAQPGTAQVQDTLRVDTLPVPEAPAAEIPDSAQGITPGGAFLRSVLIPGWGHAEVNAQVRGGFYFAFQSATAFMLYKTHTRLNRAEERDLLLEAAVSARLQAAGVMDPDELEAALAEDPEVEDSRALVEARKDQREDWMALGIFLLFLGGADAYVSAHLADFPAAVEIEATPAGGLQIGVSVPITFPPG
ncbi:hypothetical protein ACFL3S_10165 [Gemmatimonadota bacterium]